MPTSKKPPVKIRGETKPTEIKTPRDRGLTLRFWLAEKGISVNSFVEATGLGRTTINRYFRGDVDLADIDQAEAEAILEAMGIYDSEVWELLAIPEEARTSNFRSFRPFPLGSGPAAYHVAQETLREPLQGEVTLPSGSAIEIEPENLGQGIQIVQLEDGRLYAATLSMIPVSTGRRLGRLVAAYFSAQPA